jgi:hypothetical protein
MPDPSPETDTRSSNTQVCDQIGRAVGSLWQRRSGVRPASVHTEFINDVVRCTIDRGEEPEVEADADAEAPNGSSDSLGDLAYRRLAQVAVSEATGRTVTGFIAKRVKDGEPATNAFILEPVRTRH